MEADGWRGCSNWPSEILYRTVTQFEELSLDMPRAKMWHPWTSTDTKAVTSYVNPCKCSTLVLSCEVLQASKSFNRKQPQVLYSGNNSSIQIPNTEWVDVQMFILQIFNNWI